MLITVLSSILLGILVWGFINAVREYHRYKTLYGEMHTFGIPSIKQAKRHARIKGLEIRCIIYVVAIIIVLSTFIITF